MSTSKNESNSHSEDANNFINNEVFVPTSVPAFIGYVSKATYNEKSLLNTPVRITSLIEFETIFGKGAHTIYDIDVVDATQETTPEADLILQDTHLNFVPNPNTLFYLYESIKFFYQNGGATCYIIAVGTYGEETVKPAFSTTPFLDGLKLLKKEAEPTMIVIPDAVLFTENEGADCYALQQQMLDDCGTQENRVALLDIFNGFKGLNDTTNNPVDTFRNSIGTKFLSYGAAYYPWLNTTIVPSTEISFKNLSEDAITLLQELLIENSTDLKQKEVEKLAPFIKGLTVVIEKLGDIPSAAAALNQILNTSVPAYKLVMSTILKKKNMLPPSGAIAGIYTLVDNNYGVWKAPADVAVKSTTSPVVLIDKNDQENNLSTPVSGKSICAIRAFTGKGVLVCDAKTLDGNSVDWCHINIRRTVIMIEQSAKAVAKGYVFAPNVYNTWATVKAAIDDFLNNLWKAGALVGATSEDAYATAVGLGSTTTGNDVSSGIMRVSIQVAFIKPAEFITITFQQKMQNS